VIVLFVRCSTNPVRFSNFRPLVAWGGFGWLGAALGAFGLCGNPDIFLLIVSTIVIGVPRCYLYPLASDTAPGHTKGCFTRWPIVERRRNSNNLIGGE
jgi:hypothetical protein